jgi:hypothetical protein
VLRDLEGNFTWIRKCYLSERRAFCFQIAWLPPSSPISWRSTIRRETKDSEEGKECGRTGCDSWGGEGRKGGCSQIRRQRKSVVLFLMRIDRAIGLEKKRWKLKGFPVFMLESGKRANSIDPD